MSEGFAEMIIMDDASPPLMLNFLNLYSEYRWGKCVREVYECGVVKMREEKCDMGMEVWCSENQGKKSVIEV